MDTEVAALANGSVLIAAFEKQYPRSLSMPCERIKEYSHEHEPVGLPPVESDSDEDDLFVDLFGVY